MIIASARRAFRRRNASTWAQCVDSAMRRHDTYSIPFRRTGQTSASRLARQSAGAGVPSDHLDTEMMNSVIGSGEY